MAVRDHNESISFYYFFDIKQKSLRLIYIYNIIITVEKVMTTNVRFEKKNMIYKTNHKSTIYHTITYIILVLYLSQIQLRCQNIIFFAIITV